MSRFDVTDYLAETERLAQDVAGTSTDKTTLLSNNKQNKLDRLSNYSVGTVRSIYDADTLTLNQDDVSTRLRGIDTFETPKSGNWFNNESNIRRLDKQRQLLAAQSGVDPSTVTNEDIFRRGTEQTEEARSILNVDDSGLPAFVEYEQEQLTPSERQRNYGRNIGSVKPLVGPYSLPDGTEVIPKDITLGESPIDADTSIRAVDFGEIDDDGRIAENIDIAQGALAKFGADVYNMVENLVGKENIGVYNKWASSVEKTFGGDGDVGWLIDAKGNIKGTDTNIKDYRDREFAAKAFGVQQKTLDEHNAAMVKGQQLWTEADTLGEHLKAMVVGASQLDRILATSAGEIAGLGLPGGPALVAATRTSNFAEEYEKNNNKEMSNAKLAETFFSQLAVLIPEKLLIKTGVTSMLSKGGKGIEVAGAGVGEAIQEYAEGVTETIATQKEGEQTLAEIVKDPEHTFSAAIGGTMGSSLSTVAQVPGVIRDATEKLPTKNLKARLKAEMARRKEAKQTPEQKKADKIVEEEKVTTKNTISEYLDVSDTLDAEGSDIKATQAVIQAYSMLDDVKDEQERATYIARIDKRRESLMNKRLAEKAAVIDRQDTEAIQILGSSEDAIAKLKELLGVVDDLGDAKVDSALAKVSKELGINMDEIAKIKTEVKAEKSALNVIKKSQIEVEGEVVSGPRGYETYYEGLKNAKLLDDKEGVEEFTGKLEYLKDSQTRKYDKLSTAVKGVRAGLMASIERDISTRGVSKEQVIEDFLKKKFDQIPVDYSETGKPFGINPKNILQNIANSDVRVGAYSVIDAVQNSIEAMDILVPPTTKKAKVEAEKITKAKPTEPKVVKEPIKEVLPTAKEVASKIATGEKLVDADLQVQDNEGAKVEEELQALKDSAVVEQPTKKEYANADDVILETRSIDEQIVRMQGEKEVKLQEIAQLKADRKTEGKDAKESIRYELDTAYSELGDMSSELRILNENKRNVLKKLKTDKAQKLIDKSASNAEEVLEAKGTPVVTEWVSPELKTKLVAKTRAVKVILNKLIDPRTTDFRADESPFRLLMQGKGKGQYPVEVAEAMAIAISNYLGERYGELRLNDDTQIAKMLGFKNGTKIPAKVRRELVNAGRLESNEAAGIGRSIFKLLGIETKGVADHDLQARIEVDAGATALAVMEDMGLVTRDQSFTVGDMAGMASEVRGETTTETVEHADKLVAMTKIHPKIGRKWIDKAKSNKEFSEKLDEELDVNIHEKTPRYSKKRKATHHVTRNAEKWTELTKKQQEVLDTAENRAHEISQDSLVVLRDLWGSIVEDGGELSDKQIEVAKLFGWSNPKDSHIDVRSNIESKNREIVSSIQNLLTFAENAGSKDVYFDYFFSKNGRFFIDSSKINPQTDKLHRFVVGVKESKGNKTVTDKTRDTFKIAVVQAFDESKVVKFEVNGDGVEEIVNGENIRGLGAIDKQSQADNIKQFEEILNNKVIKEAVENPTSENVLKAIQGVDHPSHAIMSITELAKYKADADFETSMTMETDAVTSGFILGLLTNPVMAFSKLKKWLAKGGVWFGKNEYSTYGDWRAKGKDAYEEGAEESTKGLGTIINNTPHNGWIKHIVGEIDRKFMKNPFMVFMYGAGVASIKRAISGTAVEKVMDDLSNPDKVDTTLVILVNGISGSITQLEEALTVAGTTEQKKGIAYAIKSRKQTLARLETMSNSIESRTGEQRDKAKVAVARRIRETKVDFFYTTSKDLSVEQATSKNELSIALKGVQDIVFNTTKDTYGVAIAEYMESEFSEIVKMRKAMNGMFVGMYGAFRHEFDNRLKELQGDRKKPSKEQVDAVLDEMMKEGKIPGIMTVEAENEYEKAPIMKTARIKARQDSQVQIKTKPQRTVHPLIYDMVANPTAGAVVNIHYLDGALIMKIIGDSSGFGVHDAYVTHVNNVVGAAKKYNEQVWNLTQQFNMLERVQEEFDTAIKSSSEDVVKDAIWNNYVEAFGEPKGEDAPTRDSMYEDAIKIVKESIVTINKNKAEMKKQGATIGHMAGPEGSMYTVEGTGQEVVAEPEFDLELDAKLSETLQKLYPEIKLEYTTKDILYSNTALNQEQVNNTIKVGLRVVEALNDLGTAKPSKHGGTNQPVLSTIRVKHKEGITKKLAAKGVSKEQIEFMFEFMEQNSIGEISSKGLAERVMFGLVQNVEVKTTKKAEILVQFNEEENTYEPVDSPEFIDEDSGYYKDLTVPGGTNYKEVEISTPNVVASKKGHADFATDKGIGWYRVDDNEKSSSTLRVLEMQSDMFQKMKDKNLASTLSKAFHQMLNTDSKWVKFFIQSIVQDAQKKGYKKIRFPSGETAAKVEGHESIAEQIEAINRVVTEVNSVDETVDSQYYMKEHGAYIVAQYNISEVSKKATLVELNKEKSNLKTQGIEKLAPIEGFYQIRVKNTLMKTYGRENVKTVTDEHGNDWFELTLAAKRDSNTIMLQQTTDKKIKGQADIEAKTVLINSLLQSQDTLPHEYAHHYIAMFRDAEIVQEGIKKWGSEEALVQAIGEQTVAQKGEAYGWWKEFTQWLQSKFNKLDKKTKEELRNLLTDAFLERKNLVVEAMIKEELVEVVEPTKANEPVKVIDEVIEQKTDRLNHIISRAQAKATMSTVKWLSAFKAKVDSFSNISKASKKKYFRIIDELYNNAKYGEDGKYKYLKNIHVQREAMKDTSKDAVKAGESEADMSVTRGQILSSKEKYGIEQYEDYSAEDIAYLEEREQASTKAEEGIILKDKAMVDKAKEAITRCKK